MVVRSFNLAGFVLLTVSGFLLFITQFNNPGQIPEYLFLAGLLLLVAGLIFRAVFKTTVDAGFVGFEGYDFFMKSTDKSQRIDIANDRINQIVFKPGHSSDTYRPFAILYGLAGMFLGSHDGTDSELILKSDYGAAKYFMKFENHRQIEIFEDLIKKHPKAVILRKK